MSVLPVNAIRQHSSFCNTLLEMNLNQKYHQWRLILKKHNYRFSAELYEQYTKLYADNHVPIIWMPDNKLLEEANLSKCIQELHLDNYQQLFSWASTKRKDFWKYALAKLGIKFSLPYQSVLDSAVSLENPSWCKGARLNITDSCFQAPDQNIALIEGTENGTRQRLTYGDLEQQVNCFASGLLACGFGPGDRIILYLPFCTEAVVAFLGTIRAGITNVLVADSFTPAELDKRISVSEAKAIVTVDEYLYNGKIIKTYEKVKQLPGAITTILIRKAKGTDIRENDLAYEEIIDKGTSFFDSFQTFPEYISSILFSSGTSNTPKAIPWTQLTPVKAASDAFFHHDIRPNDRITWTTGMGWMMAPWLIYAALINKATLAIYTGAPTSEQYGAFVEKEKISILGTIPSVVKSWKMQDFHTKFNWSVRLFSSTGEPSHPEDYFYLMGLGSFQAPIIEYCGGTEIGGAYVTGTVLQPASPSFFTTPALGLDFILLKSAGKMAPAGVQGEVYILPPSIGLSQQLLNKDHHQEYYASVPPGPNKEKLRRHGDALVRILSEGMVFYKSAGRTDDAMNLGGIKVSALEIEEQVNSHPDIRESAAVAVSENGSGPESLYIFVTSDKELDTVKMKEVLQEKISKNLNPLFRIKVLKQIDQLPKTASNKLIRKQLREEVKKSLNNSDRA